MADDDSGRWLNDHMGEDIMADAIAQSFKMTAEEYAAESKAIEAELHRERGILDGHASAKERGVVSDNNPLIEEVLQDWENTIGRFRDVDREFWGLSA